MNKTTLITRIEEAYRVWDLVPDPDRRFRKGKMASWPHFVQEMSEGYGWHAVRAPRIPPSPEAIDRAVKVLEWFARHLNNSPKGAWSLWLTYGRNLSLASAGRVMGCDKKTVANRRDVAAGILIYRLSRDRPAWIDDTRATGT